MSYAVVLGDFAFATEQALDPTVVATGGLSATSRPVSIPEPSTALRLAAGLLGLGIRGTPSS